MIKNISIAAAGSEDAYRRELRVWMRQVLSARHISAESWARDAKIAGTTIRRFLNGGPEAPTPSLDTIDALAKVAGHGPNLSFAGSVARTKPSTPTVRLISHDFAALLVSRAAFHESVPSIAQYPVTSVDPGSCSTFAYAVDVDHASVNQLGVLRGDVVVIEPVWSVEPRAHDLVLIEDLSQVMVMTYYPPFAMPRSTDMTYEPRQLDDITLLGVVVELKRRVLVR